jgi:hypothetical protein
LVNITKEEIYRPWTKEDTKALPIEALLIEALLIEALLIEALLIRKALLIKALPVDTNELAIPVEINECNQLAILSANATEPLIFTLETNK